jgi:hypothetical protein
MARFGYSIEVTPISEELLQIDFILLLYAYKISLIGDNRIE